MRLCVCVGGGGGGEGVAFFHSALAEVKINDKSGQPLCGEVL